MIGENMDQIQIKAKIVNCTIKLTEEQGAQIKDIIREKYVFSFPKYAARVGIAAPNLYDILNGERSCSLIFLNKLLSGVEYEATLMCPEVLIQESQIGQVVIDADSILQENELSSQELEDQDDTDY